MKSLTTFIMENLFKSKNSYHSFYDDTQTKNPTYSYFEGANKNILISAPHHAALHFDEKTMKNAPGKKNEYRSYDVNTGSMAIRLAKKLNCSLILLNISENDYNKLDDGDYVKKVLSSGCKTLIEIHGHSEKNISSKSIEITSGSIDRNDQSMKLGSIYQRLMPNFIVSGNYDEIFYKASKTYSISNSYSYNRFHIEFPKTLCTNNSKYKDAIDKFASALIEYFKTNK